MRIIAGEFKGRTLKTITGPGYRPAMSKVRQAVFSMLESRLGSLEGLRVLDLFAGSASLAFEAISRGAAHATCVENNGKAANIIAQNAESLGLESGRCRVITEDVSKALRKRAPVAFDLIFIDPPYALDVLASTAKPLVNNGWLSEQAVVCAEVERHAALDPEKLFLPLALDTDRTYGQTRILLWSSVE